MYKLPLNVDIKEMTSETSVSDSAKEVLRYRTAISNSFEELKAKGFISINSLIDIQE